MTISYLRGCSWAQWSREERLFCAVLYEHARKAPTAFANWVLSETGLDVPLEDEWDLGYEVCFYRDHLWHMQRSASQEGYLQKRTFDLCLFGEQSVVVIEAKVCESFKTPQSANFRRDAEALRTVLEKPTLRIAMVALASSKYFVNAERFGRPGTLDVFDGRLTWESVAARFPDPLLAQADRMYKQPPGEFLRVGAATRCAAPH